MQIPPRKKRQIVPFCAHIATLFCIYTPFLPLLAVPPSRKNIHIFMRPPWDSLAYIRGQRTVFLPQKRIFLAFYLQKTWSCQKLLLPLSAKFEQQTIKSMKRFILFALAAIAFVGCSKQPNSMRNEVYDNIMTRVSVRQFTGEKISAEQIDTLLRAAMAAPSAINKQPWAFIVVTDEGIISRLGEELPFSRCSNHPACAIVPCGDLSKAIEGDMAAFWINDVSAATENLLLAAHSMGLGAVWTGVHPNMERVAQVQGILGLPEHIIPLCIVPVGVPAEQPEVKDKFRTDNIHYNKW